MPPVERDVSPPSVEGPGRAGGFGKYDFVAELARGGSAVVHLAIDRDRSGSVRLVAVKELRAELRDDADAVAAFMDGSRVAARLSHPNVVQTFDVGRYGFRCFHAMEYLDGPPLGEVVQRARRQGRPMPVPVLLRVLTDVLAGLEYAHSLADVDGKPLGLVHRDVGLHNVILPSGGVVKIVDFGGSRGRGGKSAAGDVRGPRQDAYPAPECLYGLPADRRADVFSVGVMLWQGILTSRSADSKFHTLAGPESVRADVDPKLFAIVERAMNADPSARYPTALAMRTELEGYAARSKLALPEPRVLAEFVVPLFAKKRPDVQALIDTHLHDPHGRGNGAPSTRTLRRLAAPPATPRSGATGSARHAPDSLAPTETAAHNARSFAPESAQITAQPAVAEAPPLAAAATGGEVGRFALAAACGALAAVASIVWSSRSVPPQAASESIAQPVPQPAVAVVAEEPPATPVADSPPPDVGEVAAVDTERPARAPSRKASPTRVAAAVSAVTSPARSTPAPPAFAPSAPTPASRPVIADTPAPVASAPLSAIDAPTVKPTRDIFKQDPYLQ